MSYYIQNGRHGLLTMSSKTIMTLYKYRLLRTTKYIICTWTLLTKKKRGLSISLKRESSLALTVKFSKISLTTLLSKSSRTSVSSTRKTIPNLARYHGLTSMSTSTKSKQLYKKTNPPTTSSGSCQTP